MNGAREPDSMARWMSSSRAAAMRVVWFEEDMMASDTDLLIDGVDLRWMSESERAVLIN